MDVFRALWIGAVVEAVSLAVLLANLATVHLKPVSSLVGPLHGTAYLAVIATAFLVTDASRAARLLTLVPGVGGALAVRRIRRDRDPSRGGTPA